MTADDTWIPTAPNYADLYYENQRLRAEVVTLRAERDEARALLLTITQNRDHPNAEFYIALTDARRMVAADALAKGAL